MVVVGASIPTCLESFTMVVVGASIPTCLESFAMVAVAGSIPTCLESFAMAQEIFRGAFFSWINEKIVVYN